MAEAALLTVASKTLSTLAPLSFQKAYEGACSVRNARKELDKLKRTIRTIQAGILDAERKQKDSHLIKDWLARVKEVLYDADDLFDEVATDDLLRRRVEGSNKVVKKVRVSFSRLNPFVSNNDIAKKVKKIRKTLLEISNDMGGLSLVECTHENPISRGVRTDPDLGRFVGAQTVIGRDKDKKVILDLLLGDHSNDNVQVIAIVGIGGMGKTTLTQLVYDHEEVKRCFEERWFACISDTSDDAVVCGKIYQSVFKEYNGDIEVTCGKIGESIEGKKFLLVLDDVWDHDRKRWQNRMKLLSKGAMGSKIIVSTRAEFVARAMGASTTHILNGLSEEDSWDLFKSVVSFTPEQEQDSTWNNLGREIVKKCANVPLAINCIASLLFEKKTIQEWESISNIGLPRLGQSHEDGIMPVLKLSYEHLPSNLKPCLAYCSLFPKDHRFEKKELIELWIAQGYVNPNNEEQAMEDVGHSYFMDLVRRSFLQPMVSRYYDDVQMCKMHDLINDLAIHVAGEESFMLTAPSKKISVTRHMSVNYAVDGSWILPKLLHSVDRLRSLLFISSGYQGSRLVRIEEQFANLKSLRVLSLSRLGIDNVPSLIGELKHLRYLDISGNRFKKLPDSITKLVNLCTLDISYCQSLEAWPDNFRNLINLRRLYNIGCWELMHIPPGIEELASLQQLDGVNVGKGGMGEGPMSTFDRLSELNLRGMLIITFADGVDDWDRVECWAPPLTLQQLDIYFYQGERIPDWGNGRITDPSLLPHLTSLSLEDCRRVKCLPPFRHIPNLKHLSLCEVYKLEYIQEDEAGYDELFIPDLESLEFMRLPELKGWSRKREHHSSSTCTSAAPPPPQLLSFPNLSKLKIEECENLEW